MDVVAARGGAGGAVVTGDELAPKEQESETPSPLTLAVQPVGDTAVAVLPSPSTVAVLLSPASAPKLGRAVVAVDGGGVVVADAGVAWLLSPMTVAVLLSPPPAMAAVVGR